MICRASLALYVAVHPSALQYLQRLALWGCDKEKICEIFKLALRIHTGSPFGSTRVVDPILLAQRNMQRHYAGSTIRVES